MSPMNGNTTKRRTSYHFGTSGALAAVYVEAKLEIGNNEDRLNTVGPSDGGM